MTTGEVAWRLGRAAKIRDTSPGGMEEGRGTWCGYLEQDAKVDVLFIYVPQGSSIGTTDSVGGT
jgi:hypothetical protein